MFLTEKGFLPPRIVSLQGDQGELLFLSRDDISILHLFRKPRAFTRPIVILAALLPPLCWPPQGNSRAGWFLSYSRTKRNQAERIVVSLGFTLQDVSVLNCC